MTGGSNGQEWPAEQTVEPVASAHSTPSLRPGQLAISWQFMVGVTWLLAFFAFAATWKASEEIGIGTWWLGARAQPRPLLVRLIPFALTVLVMMFAVYNVRRVALVSLVGSVAVAIIAVFDISRSGGLAAIEFAVAGATALVSVAAFSGTYRVAASPTAPVWAPAGTSSLSDFEPPTGPPVR